MRGGRDGQLAKCVLLYHFVDRKTQEFFISRMGSENDNADPLVIDEMKQRASAKLDLMVRYARIARLSSAADFWIILVMNLM